MLVLPPISIYDCNYFIFFKLHCPFECFFGIFRLFCINTKRANEIMNWSFCFSQGYKSYLLTCHSWVLVFFCFFFVPVTFSLYCIIQFWKSYEEEIYFFLHFNFTSGTRHIKSFLVYAHQFTDTFSKQIIFKQ